MESPRPPIHRSVVPPRKGVCGRAAALGLALFAGCQTYEPRPLDPAAHREAWHRRTLEAASLRAFLERLGEDAPDVGDGFDPTDGLSLAEGRLAALVLHPDLRLARLRVERAAAGAGEAGRWRDPSLQFSVLRIAESVPEPWVLAPALVFSIPLTGRPAAVRDLASAELLAAEASAREAEWDVRSAVERAWIEWSAARRRAEETERLVLAMEGLVRTTAELAAQGEMRRTEAALFAVEQAQRRNELGRLRGEVEATAQALRAVLGLAPEAELELLPTLSLPAPAAAADGPGPIGAGHPRLERLRRGYEVAEQTLRREVAEQLSPLTLGPSLEEEEGQTRLGLQGTLPLPFLNANRRAIAEARVDRELARAALETEYERLAGRWGAARARAEALAAQREDLERVLVPLVEGQLEDAVALMRLGEGTSLVLLESLTRAHRTKLDLVEARRAEALAHSELAWLLGPPRPAEAHPDAQETR